MRGIPQSSHDTGPPTRPGIVVQGLFAVAVLRGIMPSSGLQLLDMM
jgi:hypothetical protein